MKFLSKTIILTTIVLALSISVKGQFYRTGGYQGGVYGSGGDQTQDVEVLDLRVFLGGCYSSGGMSSILNAFDLLPATQPYGLDPSADWYYPGSESVDSIPGSNITDWILVELRETAAGPSTARQDSVIATRAGFLISDGRITDIDGISKLRFRNVKSVDNTYAVIKHRNHLSVMNAAPLMVTGEVRNFDYTNDLAMIYNEPGYLNNEPLAVFPDGFYGLWPGNAKPDRQVRYNGAWNDREEILNLVGPLSPSEIMNGYFPEDIDLNGKVSYMGGNNDKIKIYLILGHNALDSLKTHVPD